MAAAMILLLGYMFRNLTQLDSMCAEVLNLHSSYVDTSMLDIFQKYGVYWYDITAVKILLYRTLQTENSSSQSGKLSGLMYFDRVFLVL